MGKRMRSCAPHLRNQLLLPVTGYAPALKLPHSYSISCATHSQQSGPARPVPEVMGRARLQFAVCCALVSVAAFVYCLATSSVLNDGLHGSLSPSASRRLQQQEAPGSSLTIEEFVQEHRKLQWTPKHTAALILSVLVSLTSSLDRECGASLYVVLFAVLLNMSFRRAAAMTAFTVALGALGPGIASMSEPRLTERGVLPVVDYPATLILLPTMFWGISFGAIVNLWFPNWLLALLWVTAMTASNIELLLSFVRYIQVKREARSIAQQLRLVSPPASAPGTAAAAAAIAGGVTKSSSVELSSRAAAVSAAPTTNGATTTTNDVQQAHDAAAVAASTSGSMSRSEMVRQQGELLTKAQKLAKEAHKIEARALLYPTLYVPDVGRALEKAKIEPNPCSLRATATPSCLGTMDFEQEGLAAELKSYQTVFGRFTFSWKKWWGLNRYHFEMSLVMKIVVLHLVTEAVRHHLSKPCTHRFWIMLIGMTGLVTAMLLYTVICYARRRLWRGPHWVDALNQVRAIKKQQQEQDLKALQALGGKSPEPPASSTSTAGDGGSRGGGVAVGSSKGAVSITAATAAVAAGDAVAVQLSGSGGGGSHDGAAAVVAATDDNSSSPAVATDQQQPLEEEQPKLTRWQRFKRRTPWVWQAPSDAITNISASNSNNDYKNWRIPRILLQAAISLPIGIFGCALGLPGGPMMAHQLLSLGLKPEVVAGSSRFLVMCFTFGSFVANIISGGLEPTLAAAFGLLNLGLAPLGMFLITRVQPRGVYVIGLSLAMGVAGVVIVGVWQLVPLMAAFVESAQSGFHKQLPIQLGYGANVRASLVQAGNRFQLARFCYREGHH